MGGFFFTFAVSKQTAQGCSDISAGAHLNLEGLCGHRAIIHSILHGIKFIITNTDGAVSHVILNQMRFFETITPAAPMDTLVIIASGLRVGLIKDRDAYRAILQRTRFFVNSAVANALCIIVSRLGPSGTNQPRNAYEQHDKRNTSTSDKKTRETLHGERRGICVGAAIRQQ
uniref:Uncharacterized protein n=1 Tax=Arundo donax TaxID=35708 RepID=A0A0A8YQ50_ARUDO